MGSVTIIVILPLMILALIGSSLIGAVTGGDRTEVVLPYEPEKGIVWECDLPDSPVELVETEIDGNTQVFYFKSTWGSDYIGSIVDLAKYFINKDELPKYEDTFGDVYKIMFTDANGNEQRYYAKRSVNDDSIYIDTVDIFAPGEYYAFDYTVTAQQPVEGEYFWFNDNRPSYTECFAPEYSPTKTFTIVHTKDFENSEEYYYSMEYGYNDQKYKDQAVEYVNIKYKFTDGKLEILEEKQGIYEN